MTAMLAPLPKNYYLDNFLVLLRHVASRYADLLNEAEQRYVSEFKALSVDAQKLYVRMVMRRGWLFREDKLKYDDIADKRSAMLELFASNLAAPARPETGDTLLNLLTRAELATLIEGGVSAALKRHSLVERLQTGSPDWAEQVCRAFPIVQVSGADYLDTFLLLFFGTLSQDLSEFVLRDLGINRYADYSLDTKWRMFEQRAQIDAHLLYYRTRQQCLEGDLANAVACLGERTEVLAHCMAMPELQRRWRSLFYHIGRDCERAGMWEEANTLYTLSDNNDALQRLARRAGTDCRYADALALCRRILACSPSVLDEEFVHGFGARLAKKSDLDFPSKPLFSPKKNTILLDQRPDESVEETAARWLCRDGEPCFFVENRLFSLVFLTLYWDVLFTPVSGAFTHPFQRRPHDLYEPDFLERRRDVCLEAEAMFEQRLKDPDALYEQMRACAEVANPFFYGSLPPEEAVTLALQRLSFAQWQRIFSRIWRDPKQHRSGFPDLVFFPATGGVELIEVKGPGDTLQPNQRRWLRYFSESGIPASVLHVKWNAGSVA